MEENKEIDHELQQDDGVSIELPAPSGWIKKYIPKKSGSGTPRVNAIFFTSPTGEEIKSKRQLEKYLKAHPGGASISEFDWGTGDTPRRSARLTGKSKMSDSPGSETPSKKPRKSSGKKQAKEKNEEVTEAIEIEDVEDVATTKEEENKPEPEPEPENVTETDIVGPKDDDEEAKKEENAEEESKSLFTPTPEAENEELPLDFEIPTDQADVNEEGEDRVFGQERPLNEGPEVPVEDENLKNDGAVPVPVPVPEAGGEHGGEPPLNIF